MQTRTFKDTGRLWREPRPADVENFAARFLTVADDRRIAMS